MPSTSRKQHNFMAEIAKNPAFAKKAGIPQSVGSEFLQADKGRKFAKGGDMKDSKMNSGFMAMIAKKKEGAKKKDAMPKMAKGGGIESKGKTKGKMVKMKSGGGC
jgi:hypothetical protein